jgi:hypothetical protein
MGGTRGEYPQRVEDMPIQGERYYPMVATTFEAF